jgi:hypothetical protein
MNQRINIINGGFESPLIYRNFFSTKVLDQLNSKIADWNNGNIPVTQLYVGGAAEGMLGTFFTLNDDKEICENIWNEINSVYDISLIDWYDCGIQIHGSGTILPWHGDYEYSFTLTTYLNQEHWNWNWGGALLCQYPHGEILAEFPEYNKTILISGTYSKDNNMSHATTMVTPGSPIRISLQIFASPEHGNPSLTN